MAPGDQNTAARLLQLRGPWYHGVKKWASQIPKEPALIWLDRKADVVSVKTYEDLDSEATKLAMILKMKHGRKQGDRLILCYPPGLDFVVAFVACQILGAVAVPLYFPRQTQRNKDVHGLLALVRKVKAWQCLLTSSVCRQSEARVDECEKAKDGRTLQWVFTDELIRDNDAGCPGGPPDLTGYVETTPTDVAFMQLSSGSTGTPKGCLITQAGFLHNIHHNWYMSGIYCSTRGKSIYEVPLEDYVEFTEDYQNIVRQRWGHRLRFLSWLPVTHDMGLVGMIGVPLFFGCTAYFMSPSDFLSTPSAWLEAFSRHQCSFTAAPDFAYALAARKVPDALLKRLSFTKALAFINGAEPIRERTLEVFAAKFGVCGFEPWMMCPAYGLAENTVGVTGRGRDGMWPRAPRILRVSRDSLFPGETVRPIPLTEPAKDMAAVKSIVGCGASHGDVIVKIVHPDTLKELPEWHVGEVWVSSPSLALGYFEDPAATASSFEAYLVDASPDENATLRYLRTGDLGFTSDGELYITGRLKSVLIIRGQNYYLQDFEEAIECCPHIRKGCAMAFPVTGEQDDLEGLGAAAEVERSVTGPAELHAIAEEVKRRVYQSFHLPVRVLWLTEAGTLPKTTSGKPRRYAAKEMLEKGLFEGVLYRCLPHPPYDAPGRTNCQRTQSHKQGGSREALLLEDVSKDECTASFPRGQNGCDTGAPGMPSQTLKIRAEEKHGEAGTDEPCLAASDSVERVIIGCFAEVFGDCGLPLSNDTPLGILNLDSLSAVELAAALKRKLNVQVEPFAFFDCPDIGSVVAVVKDVLLRALEVNQSPPRELVASVKKPSQDEIYITGMACKFPRGCDEPADFWTRLLQKDQFICAPPPERNLRCSSLRATSFTPKLEDYRRDWQGGFLNDISMFDNTYFSISAAEAAAMDPQQRLLLMQAVEALTSRGIAVSTPSQTGVFVGCCSDDWQRLSSAERTQAFTATAQSSCMLANRISYNLNFTGPSVTVDTACSSALVALHYAWQEMTACGGKDCAPVDAAIVAAVNLMLVFDTTLALQRSGFLSSTYRCRTFDAAADGFVRSEGAAAVVLEKINGEEWGTLPSLAAQKHDGTERQAEPAACASFSGSGEDIHSTRSASGKPCLEKRRGGQNQQTENNEVSLTIDGAASAASTPEVAAAVRGSLPRPMTSTLTAGTCRKSSKTPRKAWCRVMATAVVHGGKTASVTAPCRASQEQLCRQALSRAGASPDEISYVETHGTGTALGDPIEVAALVTVFGSSTSSRSSPLILGAVKTNLGHLEGAAGMAGLLKCSLCLAHHKVPANLHLKKLNPHIDFQQLPVILPCKTVPLNVSAGSATGGRSQLKASAPTYRESGGHATLLGGNGTNATTTGSKGTRCLLTSLGFGGTYAQAVLATLSPDSSKPEIKSALQEPLEKKAWTLKHFDNQNPLLWEAAPLPPVVSPAYVWQVAWKQLPDDLQDRSPGISWRTSCNRSSLWLILSFLESNVAYWKSLRLRDVQAVVQPLSPDSSEQFLQGLLQSRSWHAVLFVDGAHVQESSAAVEVILSFLRVVPLVGKLMSRLQPCCRMFLLTHGSQLVQQPASSSFSHRNDPPPHAAGMLGFARACRAELSYSTGKPFPLYFIDLDPQTALVNSVAALASRLQKFRTDEVDISIRQGKVYVPRLLSAGPLHFDADTPFEESREATDSLYEGEAAVHRCSRCSCPISTMPHPSETFTNNPAGDRQRASSCRGGLSPCACQVRVMSVCTDRIIYTVDGKPERSVTLVGCSGIVVAVGSLVREFRVGDAVCGFAPLPGETSYVSSTTCSHLLQPLPASFSFEAAAAIPTKLAQVIRAASMTPCFKGGSCSTSNGGGSHVDASSHVWKHDDKPLTDTATGWTKCSPGEHNDEACFYKDNHADGDSVTGRTTHQSHFPLHGRATLSTVISSEIPPLEGGPKATSRLQSGDQARVSDGESRSREERSASFEADGQDEEDTQRIARVNIEGRSAPCTRVTDASVRSSRETSVSHAPCPHTELVMADGSGAGLMAAVYFRSKGRHVVGMPVSEEQQLALEALSIPVLGVAGVRGRPEEQGPPPGVRSAEADTPGAVAKMELAASSERAPVQARANQGGTPPANLPAISDAKLALNVAEMGGTLHAARGAAATQVAKGVVPADIDAPEEKKKAGMTESGPGGGPDTAGTTGSTSPASQPAEAQAAGNLDISLFHQHPFNGVLYCTLRSQECVQQLMPWVAAGSLVYDFAFSTAQDQARRCPRSQLSRVQYRNSAIYHFPGDACSEVLPLSEELRDACHLLKEHVALCSLVELHVFLDDALERGAAFREACDFADTGTHAGNVVCAYPNPILQVSSVFVGSPASYKAVPASPAAPRVERACGTAVVRRGNEVALPALARGGLLSTKVTASARQEAGDQGQSNSPIDYPDEEGRDCSVAACFTGENAFLSAEERRDATYVVSGDPRGLSATVARWLVEEGALYVVFLHEESIRWHAEESHDWKWFQNTNTSAHTGALACSLQSKESIQVALRKIKEELHFPPIRGIIHVPCDTPPDLANDLDNAGDKSRLVLKHKALAAWSLHYALDELHLEDSLQLFVLFSGVSGLFGCIRREAACAANTALDMLACYRNSQGLSGLSIQWPPWLTETGQAGSAQSRVAPLTCESEPLLRAWLSKIGISGISYGFSTLRQILALHMSGQTGAVVACFAPDPTLAGSTGTSDEGWMPKAIASPQIQRGQSHADTEAPSLEITAASVPLAVVDNCCNYTGVFYELVYREVATLVGHYVAVEKGQIPQGDEPLTSLGMDSLTAAELKYELQSRFRVELDSQVMQQHASIATVANSIFSQICANLPDSPTCIRNSSTRDNIAVVSVSLRLPGGCCCPGTLWGMLLAGTDCSKREIRRPGELQREDLRSVLTRSKFRCTAGAGRACYLDGIDTFDSDFFGLSVPESLVANRQAQVLLPVAYEALFNTNLGDHPPQTGSPVAVYATGSASCSVPADAKSAEPFCRRPGPPELRIGHEGRQSGPARPANLNAAPTVNGSHESLPGVISYVLSLSGTSISVNAGSASSLAALCLAADHLGSNPSVEAALVGAVRLLPVPPQDYPVAPRQLRRDRAPMGSSCCARTACDAWLPFDEVQGEGAIAVVLQKLRVAEARANPVLAIIRGRSMTHVGRRSTAASGGRASCTAAVRSVLEGALASAGADRSEVAVVESPGAGLPTGSGQAEWEAIAQVYGKERLASNEFPVVVSSLKGNVGCLCEAAGLAGIVKVLLMLAGSQASDEGGCVVIPATLQLHRVGRCMRDIASDGQGGLLFPSKTIVRRSAPAAGGSAKHRLRSVADGLSSSADNPAAEATAERSRACTATSVGGNLFRSRPVAPVTSSEKSPGAFSMSVPRGQRFAYAAQEDFGPYRRKAKLLGGVTACARSGVIAHVLLEGAAATPEAIRAFSEAELRKDTAQQSPARAGRSAPAATTGDSGDRIPPVSSSAFTAVDDARTTASAKGCLGFVGNSKRSLWLFSDDCANVLYCGRPLYFTNKIFAKELDRCSELMWEHLPTSLGQLLYPTCEAELLASVKFLQQPLVATLSLFAVQWSLAHYLRQTAQGRLICVTGVGAGEIVAAAVAGLLSIDEAIRLLIAIRSTGISHRHDNDIETPAALPLEKFSSAAAGARLFCMHSSSSQSHTCTNVDYGLSTDGEQTYRSDCLSLYDGTDASCRSIFWNNETGPASGVARDLIQPEQPGFGLTPASLSRAENSEQLSHPLRLKHLRDTGVSAFLATACREIDPGKPNLQELGTGVETAASRLPLDGRLEDASKGRSALIAGVGASTPVEFTRLPVLHAGQLAATTGTAFTQKTACPDGISRSPVTSANSMIRPAVRAARGASPFGDAFEPHTEEQSVKAGSRDASEARSAIRSNEEGKAGSCYLPLGEHAAVLPLVAKGDRGCDQGATSSRSALRSRGGPLKELKVTDTPRQGVTPACCLPFALPISSPISSSFSRPVADTPGRRRASVDDFLLGAVRRAEETLRDEESCRSRMNKLTLPGFPHAFTPTPRERRASLQYVTPTHAKISSHLMKPPPLVSSFSLAGERGAAHSNTPNDYRVAGGMLPVSGEGSRLSADASLRECNPCYTPSGAKTPLHSPSASHWTEVAETPARSTPFYAPLGRDRILFSAHQKKDAYGRNVQSSDAGMAGLNSVRSHCVLCEEIRTIVSKISKKQATCVFLSATAGTAAPDFLLRDPLYWCFGSPRKLRLKTTVTVAKKVLRTAALVQIGPPAAGPLRPASLIKLAKHLEIFRFTGRCDSPEAVISCGASSSSGRAAVVCTDIVLRVPHAAPCWNHEHTQSSNAFKLPGVDSTPFLSQANLATGRPAHHYRKEYIRETRATLSD